MIIINILFHPQAPYKIGVVYVMKEIVNEWDTKNYAGFWRRFVAIIIDGFILGVPMAFAIINPSLYKAVKGNIHFGI